jgi:hypothetical protein
LLDHRRNDGMQHQRRSGVGFVSGLLLDPRRHDGLYDECVGDERQRRRLSRLLLDHHRDDRLQHRVQERGAPWRERRRADVGRVLLDHHRHDRLFDLN